MKSKHLSSLKSAILGSSLLVAGVMALSAPAQAFTVTIDPQYGSTENTGSSAFLDFNFVQQNTNTVLNLLIKNTSSVTSTLVGVGFDTPGGISQSSYNSLGSAFVQLFNDVSLSPYGSFDIGIRSAGSGGFGGGNPQAGLTNGQSATVSFTFNNQNASSLESSFLSLFSQPGSVVGRFQQVGANREGSDKVLGQAETAAVPEPTTMAGLALAGAGLAAARRRKAAKEAAMKAS